MEKLRARSGVEDEDEDDDEAATRASEGLGLAAVRAALRAAESMSYEGFAN
jgi:hypothetical protein